jgi:biotin synthase
MLRFIRLPKQRPYNHNLETSRRFFNQIVTTHSYDDRIATVLAAKQAGLEVCCGGIIGMGETLEDRVDLALELRKLEVDSVPLNFLNPIAGTPLEDQEPLAPMEALQTIAVFRFILPDKQIKIAGGRENCLRDLQSWMFYAGASSTMIGNYLTTKGRSPDDDFQMLADLELPHAADK